MAILTYYPEMKQAKPAAAFEAKMSFYGRHYFVQTRRTIQGQGITFIRTLTVADLVPQASHKAGTNEYKLTARAFDALCKAEAVSMETLL